eukprot:8888672-Pyramimonas_sp.AAC.1
MSEINRTSAHPANNFQRGPRITLRRSVGAPSKTQHLPQRAQPPRSDAPQAARCQMPPRTIAGCS